MTLQFYGLKNIVSGKSSKQIENFLEKLTKPAKKQKKIMIMKANRTEKKLLKRGREIPVILRK